MLASQLHHLPNYVLWSKLFKFSKPISWRKKIANIYWTLSACQSPINIMHSLSHLVLKIVLWSRYYYYPILLISKQRPERWDPFYSHQSLWLPMSGIITLPFAQVRKWLILISHLWSSQKQLLDLPFPPCCYLVKILIWNLDSSSLPPVLPLSNIFIMLLLGHFAQAIVVSSNSRNMLEKINKAGLW